MWNGLYTAEKTVIQWTLLCEACYFAVQFLGDQTFLAHWLAVPVTSLCQAVKIMIEDMPLLYSAPSLIDSHG